ncbi:MAG: OmpA family protein [Myxococcaceae bacterium]
MKRSFVAAALAFVSVSFGVGCTAQRAAAPKPLTIVEVEPYRPTATEKQELEELLSQATLHFDFDEYTLSENNRERLDFVADALRMHPWAGVKIKGHTDERGTEEYNLALGQRRADAAKTYLVAMGVDPSVIDTVTFGDEQPVAEGSSEDAWSLNRRDELEPSSVELFGLGGSR